MALKEELSQSDPKTAAFVRLASTHPNDAIAKYRELAEAKRNFIPDEDVAKAAFFACALSKVSFNDPALMHAAHYILFNRWWPSDATALSYLVAFAHDKNYTAGIVALFDALGVSLVSLVDETSLEYLLLALGRLERHVEAIDVVTAFLSSSPKSTPWPSSHSSFARVITAYLKECVHRRDTHSGSEFWSSVSPLLSSCLSPLLSQRSVRYLARLRCASHVLHLWQQTRPLLNDANRCNTIEAFALALKELRVGAIRAESLLADLKVHTFHKQKERVKDDLDLLMKLLDEMAASHWSMRSSIEEQ